MQRVARVRHRQLILVIYDKYQLLTFTFVIYDEGERKQLSYFNTSQRFGRVCTDDRRVSLYFTMVRPFSIQNCPFPWGIWTPCNRAYVVPWDIVAWAHQSPEPKRQLDRFSRSCSVTD